jgi:ABC-type lipopolysaccharide export system ATPase subunit
MVNESDFKANTVASFNFDEEYPGINPLKVKAIIKVVTEIKKIAPMVATTKHSLSLILKKISLQKYPHSK